MRCLKKVFLNYSLFCGLLLCMLPGFSQSGRGILTGRVFDASTFKTLYGVSVFEDSSIRHSKSDPDGTYLVSGLKKGLNTIIFRLDSFQTKVITTSNYRNDQVIFLDIILSPLSGKAQQRSYRKDSLSHHDSLIYSSLYKESRLSIYNEMIHSGGFFDFIAVEGIQSGAGKDDLPLLKKLSGIAVTNSMNTGNFQSLNIYGLGERYNQVQLNGSLLTSFNPYGRHYQFGLIPAEAIESASVQKIADASVSADFAGGNVDLLTKDFPEKNFLYIQAGSGFSSSTNGNTFFGEKHDKWEAMSFSGSNRSLPAGFPTTRSRSQLSEKNPQEQVYISKQLKNNIAPVNFGSSKPDDKFQFGFGKIIRLKKGERIGLFAIVTHQKSESIDEGEIQVAPQVAFNPFPFSDLSKPLIKSFSKDKIYNYSSQLTAILNASILFGRNKVSLKSFLGSYFTNTFTRRSQLFKPDEDTLAHDGIIYLTGQRKFINVQLSGEHALGKDSKFKVDWQASYSYINQQNPDERNFLLKQDSSAINKYEIARPDASSLSSPALIFTNTGRLWRNYSDHNFTGSFKILVPFNMLNHAQVLSGGIYIQTRNRIFFSDFLLTQGKGYFPLDGLLAPERYYPNGLSVQNYYSNVKITPGVNFTVNETNRANYTASANLGASYIRIENRFTNSLSLNWGIRLESNNQLVSSTQYNYFDGYRNPQLGTLDENTRVSKFNILPSFDLRYQPFRKFRLHAAFFRSVNRPELQELSLFKYYDASSFMVKMGNPILTSSNIANYDAGFDWFANGATHFSISGFYKKIDQPVEYILSSYSNAAGNLLSIPHNTPPATIRGLTASLKVKFNFISSARWLSNVSLFATGNWLKTEVEAGAIRSAATPFVAQHTLSGSPDYTLNMGLIIQCPQFPGITVLYNRTGDYISLVGSGNIYQLNNGNMVSAIPDYRIRGRNQIDIQVCQNFLKDKIRFVAGVTNVANDAYIEYQDLNGNKRFDTPVVLDDSKYDKGGFYHGGIDNSVRSIKAQRNYYLTLSYFF